MLEKLNFRFLDNFNVLIEDVNIGTLPQNYALYVDQLYNSGSRDVVIRTYGKQAGRSHKKNIRFITIGFKEDVLAVVRQIYIAQELSSTIPNSQRNIPDINEVKNQVHDILTNDFSSVLESNFFATLVDRFLTNFMNKFIGNLRDVLSTNSLKPIYFQEELDKLIPRLINNDVTDYPYLMILLPILIHKGNIYSIDVSRIVSQGEPYITLITGGAIKNGHRYFTILTSTRSTGVFQDRYNHVITTSDVAAKHLPIIYEAFIKQQTRLQMGYTLSEVEDKLRKIFTIKDRKTVRVRKSVFTNNPLEHNIQVIADLYYLRLDLHTVKEEGTGINEEHPYLEMSLLTDSKTRVVYKGFLYLPFSTGFTMIVMFKDFDSLYKFLNDFISNINNIQRMIMKEIISLIEQANPPSDDETKQTSIVKNLKDYISSSLIYGGGLSVEGVILTNSKNGFKRAYSIYGKNKQFYLDYMTAKGISSTIYDLLIGDASSYQEDIKKAQKTLEKISVDEILNKYKDIKNLELKDRGKMYEEPIIEGVVSQTGFLPFLFDSIFLDKWIADYLENNGEIKVMLNSEFLKDLYKNFPNAFKKQAIKKDWENFKKKLQSQGVDITDESWGGFIETYNDFLECKKVEDYMNKPKSLINNLKSYIKTVKKCFLVLTKR